MSGHAQSPERVVGIDDSTAAVTAVMWALDEALCRDAPFQAAISRGRRTSSASSGRRRFQ